MANVGVVRNMIGQCSLQCSNTANKFCAGLFAGLSSSGMRTPAGPSVTAVLQSAGWGSTSPAKRIPKALPAGAVGQQLAEYEALLPAEPDDCVGAPVVSPE